MADKGLAHEYSKPQRASPKPGRSSESGIQQPLTAHSLSTAIKEGAVCNSTAEETMIQHFNISKTFSKIQFLLKLLCTKFIILPMLLTHLVI